MGDETPLEKRHMRTGSGPGMSASSFCVALAAAWVAAGCSAKSSAPFPDVTSATDCETQRESVCNADANDAASTGSRTRKYTQANAAACIDRVNGLFGNNASMIAFKDLVGPGSLIDVCKHVFSGSAAFNEPCQSPYDCADGNDACVPVSPGSPALVCAPPTKVAIGALCQNAGSVCD